MDIYERYEIQSISGSIIDYANETITTLEKLLGSSGKLSSDRVEKKNFFDPQKHIFKLNFIDIHEATTVDYGFCYMALTQCAFESLSTMMCKTYEIEIPPIETRISSVNECSNRIGARLLRFITPSLSQGSFDISTPQYIAPLASSEPAADKRQRMPSTVLSTTIEVGGISIEFGCSNLKSLEQRISDLYTGTLQVLNISKENRISKEQSVDKPMPLFDMHFQVRLITDEVLIISIPKKQLFNARILLADKQVALEQIRSLLNEQIARLSNVADIEILEGAYPMVSGEPDIRLLTVVNQSSQVHIMIGMAIERQVLAACP